MIPVVSQASYSVEDWSTIKNDFKGADLLLGNGFSVNIANSLNYPSLFDEFINVCTNSDRQVFEAFKTSNFEFIMSDLSSASKVNSIFGQPTQLIDQAIAQLRNGLVTAIETLHPRCNGIDRAHLKNIADSFEWFNDIFTLNYDVLAYHIIMLILDEHKKGKKVGLYQDYYWRTFNSNYLEFMDFQNLSQYKNLYYLHGALFLFHQGAHHLKIKRTSNRELIESIADEIRNGHMPLFVSEGTAEEKEAAISRSSYLSFALAKLKNGSNPIVIYGTSLSDPDRHIRDAISSKYSVMKRRIAYGLYTGSKTHDQITEEVKIICSRFPLQDVKFFDTATLFAP